MEADLAVALERNEALEAEVQDMRHAVAELRSQATPHPPLSDPDDGDLALENRNLAGVGFFCCVATRVWCGGWVATPTTRCTTELTLV